MRAISVWRLDSCECVATLEGHTDMVRSVAWGAVRASSAAVVVSGSVDGTVRIWQLSTATPSPSGAVAVGVTVLTDGDGGIYSVSDAFIGPHGMTMVASSVGDCPKRDSLTTARFAIRLWDLGTMTCVIRLTGTWVRR